MELIGTDSRGDYSAEDLKRIVRTVLNSFRDRRYGWGPRRDGLPIRTDVFRFVVDWFCRPGEAPFSFAGACPAIVLDPRGGVELAWATDRGRSLLLAIPCDGVVVATQKYAGSNTTIEQRIDAHDPEVFAAEVGELRDWLAGEDR